jgi:hypothetical protein
VLEGRDSARMSASWVAAEPCEDEAGDFDAEPEPPPERFVEVPPPDRL